MSDFKDWCEKVMPFVIASSNGEVVQESCDNGNSWFDMSECERSDPALQFDFDDYDYRIKPRTIKIGDFDVPEPMRTDIGIGNKYFTPSLASASAIGCKWLGDGRDYELLRNGLCHDTCEAEEVHAKALIALTSAK